MRVAKHGHSVEAEVRAILDAVAGRPEEIILLSLHATMTETGGIDLPPIERTDLPRAVDLS